MSVEEVSIRLQTLKVDTNRQLAEHFKTKLQLEEQLEDNEVKLHFCRGVMACCDEVEDIIRDVQDKKDVAAALRQTMGVEELTQAMEKSGKEMVAPDEEVDKLISQLGDQGE